MDVAAPISTCPFASGVTWQPAWTDATADASHGGAAFSSFGRDGTSSSVQTFIRSRAFMVRGADHEEGFPQPPMQTKYNERARDFFSERAPKPSSPRCSDGRADEIAIVALRSREVQERPATDSRARRIKGINCASKRQSRALGTLIAGTDWQAVPAADGKSYYWNTKSACWDPPWARSDWIASSSSQRQQNGTPPRPSSSSGHSPSKSPKARSPSKRPKRRMPSISRQQEEADITTGAGLSYAGGGRHDVASLIFKKHDSDGDGILSVAELAKLCASMDRPLEDKSVELLRSDPRRRRRRFAHTRRILVARARARRSVGRCSSRPSTRRAYEA